MLKRLFTLGLIIISLSSSAQLMVGYGMGLNINHALLSETKIQLASKTEFVLPIGLADNSMLDIGLRYNQLGYKDFKIDDDYDQVIHKFQVAEAAVVFKKMAGKKRAAVKPFLGAGLKFGYVVGGNAEFYADSASALPDFFYTYSEEENGFDNLNRLRVGMVLEAGLNLKLSKRAFIMLGVGYELDFLDMFSEESMMPDEDNAPLASICLNTRLVITP